MEKINLGLFPTIVALNIKIVFIIKIYITYQGNMVS